MRLENDLFRIVSSSHPDDGTHAFRLRLRPDHAIFQGHFPGNPIMPGVCQIGIAEELLSSVVGRRVQLAAVVNIKYMNVLSPTQSPEPEFHFTAIRPEADGTLAVQCVLKEGTHVYSKMSLRMR